MLGGEKGGAPAKISAVAVPEKETPAGFAPMVTATAPVKPGTVFPRASRAVTCTAGVMAASAVVLLGCVVKPSWAAEPAVIVKEELVVPARPVAVAESL